MSHAVAEPLPIPTTSTLAPELNNPPPYKPLSKSDIIGLVLFGVCGVLVIAVFYLVILPIFYRCFLPCHSPRDEESGTECNSSTSNEIIGVHKAGSGIEGHLDNVRSGQKAKTWRDGWKFKVFGVVEEEKDVTIGRPYGFKRYGAAGNSGISLARGSSGARVGS